MADRIDEKLQDAYPEATLLLAELLGNLAPRDMPFNVQNLIGNWLQLVGQIILVFNAQQQLWQNGPGHYYSRCNKNISNTLQTDQDDTFRCAEHQQQLREELDGLRQRIARLERCVDASKQ